MQPVGDDKNSFMNNFPRRFFQLMMVGCFVAAVFEASWTIVAMLFAASFLGFLTTGMIQGTIDNQDFELHYRLADEYEPVADIDVALQPAPISVPLSGPS